nr:putative serine protease K12H4.7 [Onthophagus taurus]
MGEIVSTLSSNNNDGLNTISNDFRSCSPLNLAEPYRSYFFSGLISPFASLVQYAQSSSIQAVCNSILSNPGSSYEKFKQYFNSYYAGSCIGNYDGFIDYLDYPLPNGDYRQWMYQTCAEYGFYQTTSSNNTIFGKNTVIVDLYRKMCEDVYGITPEMLNSGIERTNFFYGGLKPSYTKVVSVHGTIDPWSSIGLTEDLNDDAPVFVVEGTSHCADISSESVYDIAQMRETKRKVKELIAKWITD